MKIAPKLGISIIEHNQNQLWMWSGHINMPNFGSFLPCVLPGMHKNTKFFDCMALKFDRWHCKRRILLSNKVTVFYQLHALLIKTLGYCLISVTDRWTADKECSQNFFPRAEIWQTSTEKRNAVMYYLFRCVVFQKCHCPPQSVVRGLHVWHWQRME